MSFDPQRKENEDEDEDESRIQNIQINEHDAAAQNYDTKVELSHVLSREREERKVHVDTFR